LKYDKEFDYGRDQLEQFPLISTLRYNALENDIVNENDREKTTHDMYRKQLLWEYQNIDKIMVGIPAAVVPSPDDPNHLITFDEVLEIIL
jgi:hypothetical protein